MDLRKPHVWFAWRPVQAEHEHNGRKYWVWLEHVYRTGTYYEDSLGGDWVYAYKLGVPLYP